MPNSLQALFSAIHQAQDERQLRSQVVPQIGEYFTARRSGVFFFDELPFANPQFQQVLEAGLSLEQNAIVRYLVERHTPVHEGSVASPKVWQMMCPRPDHWHVMAGPLVSQGQLVGAVGCTRDRTLSAFNAQDLADMSALCLHLSTWTVATRRVPVVVKCDRLTPRELQIAERVAMGQTNAEIGQALWITENSVKQALKRMFRKLEVSSRAQLVAQLSVQHSTTSLSSSQ
jgi:DNA-binding CsgD family transcriptional regulator